MQVVYMKEACKMLFNKENDCSAAAAWLFIGRLSFSVDCKKLHNDRRVELKPSMFFEIIPGAGGEYYVNHGLELIVQYID